MDTDTLLLDASQAGNIGQIQDYLDEGSDPNAQNKSGLTSLHFAVKGDDCNLVELLLEYGADPNTKDNIGSTPLNYAAGQKQDGIVQLLLDYWANPNNKDDSGWTPLHNAAKGGSAAIANLLIKSGADVEARNNNGETPLHLVTNTDTAAVLMGENVELDKTQVAPNPVFPIVINETHLDASIHPSESETDYILIQTESRLSPSQRLELEIAGLAVHEYISKNTYLCRRNQGLGLDDISRLSSVVYTDTYRQELKLAPGLERLDTDTIVEVDILFHIDVGVGSDDLQARIAKEAKLNLGDIQFYGNKVRLSVGASYIGGIAAIDEVRHIERVGKIRPCNNVAREILGCTTQVVGAAGTGETYHGKGQVIAIADSGLDQGDTLQVHPAFGQRVNAIHAINGEKRDFTGHGTHVCGSAVGDGWTNNKVHVEGTAPQACLVVQSIWDPASPHYFAPPPNLVDLFGPPYYDDKARVHSNSWVSKKGPGQLSYSAGSREIDDFAWDHKDMVICFAAGNDAQYEQNHPNKVLAGQICCQATAKNCITVGATENEGRNSQITYATIGFQYPPVIGDRTIDRGRSSIAAFSSRGDIRDHGRIKPDVVAPGTYILSASSRARTQSTAPFYQSGDNLWCYDSGTSMATPLVAGAAGVLREALIANGCRSPSAALVKALLINGAEPVSNPIPSIHSGFGLVNLERSIMIACRKDGTGICEDSLSCGSASQGSAGQGSAISCKHEFVYTIPVKEKHTALKVTLVWSDPPGERIINQLVLKVNRSDTEQEWGHTGRNTTNAQQVILDRGKADSFSLSVRVFQHLKETPQPFSLVWRID